MEKITYIIPIHKFNDVIEKLFTEAINSIKNIKEASNDIIMLVGPQSVIEKAQKVCEGLSLTQRVTLVVNEEDTNAFTQINKGVLKCLTNYFSVLELDDKYTPNWKKGVFDYNKGYSVILPICQILQDDTKQATLCNEIAWSSAFSDNIGFIGIEELNAFKDFSVTGGLIKTEDFISVGGLKPSMKIAAWYEFLLRMSYKTKTIAIAPKIGYIHVIGRNDSYSSEIIKLLSQEEGEWLVKTAQQEYFFKEDRGRYFGEDETDFVNENKNKEDSK